MAAVSSLPELTERKRVLDKHTNILTALMQHISARGLDSLHHTEGEVLAGRASLPKVAELVQVWFFTPKFFSSQVACAQINGTL